MFQIEYSHIASDSYSSSWTFFICEYLPVIVSQKAYYLMYTIREKKSIDLIWFEFFVTFCNI